MTDLDFTGFLNDRGVAVVATEDTIHDLKERYGVKRWFDFEDIVELPPAPLFPEQAERFLVRATATCLIPPNEIECDFNYHRNGPRNHALALERLSGLFGTHEPGIASNTLSATWRFEHMSLSIRTFLRDKTPGRSELYEKHPELWDVCRITIDRNWVRTLSQPEAAMLSSPATTLPFDPAFVPEHRSPQDWERGLFRRANPHGSAAVWKHDGAPDPGQQSLICAIVSHWSYTRCCPRAGPATPISC